MFSGSQPLQCSRPCCRNAGPSTTLKFETVYDQLRKARNDALHEGAFARHLASHAVIVALVLEDALMTGLDRIADYMVRSPVCACMWHPLSFIRQTMLSSSFSFLPVNAGSEESPEWRLVSDCGLASFLRPSQPLSRKSLLGLSLAVAVKEHGLRLEEPHRCSIDESIQATLSNSHGLPVLVLSADQKQLLGIATAFDLL